MSTAQQARQAIRTRLQSAGLTVNGQPLPLRFQNEEADSLGSVPLPAEPSPFAYVEFVAERPFVASYGGGRGSNRYRNPARIEGYVFVRKGDGLDVAEQIAEQIAALFRSHRDEVVSCFEAGVFAGGDASVLQPRNISNAIDLNAYFYAAFEVSLFFDQIG